METRLPWWLNGNEECNAGGPGSIPGSVRSPGGGHGNLLQYSCLENPVDGEAWQATVHRITKSRTRLKQLSTHAWVFQWSINLYLFQHRYFAFLQYLLLAIVGHQVWEAGRKCSFLVLHSHHLFDFIILVCSNDVRNNSEIYYIIVCRCVLQCNSPSKSEMLIMEKI